MRIVVGGARGARPQLGPVRVRLGAVGDCGGRARPQLGQGWGVAVDKVAAGDADGRGWGHSGQGQTAVELGWGVAGAEAQRGQGCARRRG